MFENKGRFLRDIKREETDKRYSKFQTNLLKLFEDEYPKINIDDACSISISVSPVRQIIIKRYLRDTGGNIVLTRDGNDVTRTEEIYGI